MTFFQRFPFNYKNPLGYIFAFLVTYAIIFYMIFFGVARISFMLKTFWNFVSLAKDLKTDLVSIESSTENRPTTMKQFNKFIQFHTNVKQLSFNTDTFH